MFFIFFWLFYFLLLVLLNYKWLLKSNSEPSTCFFHQEIACEFHGRWFRRFLIAELYNLNRKKNRTASWVFLAHSGQDRVSVLWWSNVFIRKLRQILWSSEMLVFNYRIRRYLSQKNQDGALSLFSTFSSKIDENVFFFTLSTSFGTSLQIFMKTFIEFRFSLMSPYFVRKLSQNVDFRLFTCPDKFLIVNLFESLRLEVFFEIRFLGIFRTPKTNFREPYSLC